MILVYAFLFLMEVASLAAFAYWGFGMGKSRLAGFLFGIGTPLLAALFWGAFISPNAPHRLEVPIRTIIKIALFALAAAALYSGMTMRKSL
ncbi:YrdB family protein [Oceanobacillus damuensis]|uniref:YrdB family protein n=1 Tax=Oceanobacillus damuensis TaxID=937928 RepID=UPI00082FE3DC|nr:YrdB family protein [Oceanobacillus damuensis]